MIGVFRGANLRLARLANNLSLQELGERVDRSKQYLSRLEADIERPTIQLERELAPALEVLPEFFSAADKAPIADEQCHFRKQLTTRASLRELARARGELLTRVVAAMEDRVQLPKYGFLDGDASSPDTIERAAEKCRREWGLGTGPIANVTRVAECAGAVVIRISGLSNEIDAISFATARPVIALNSDGRSACRSRFGVAHEIGHLTLHAGTLTGDRLTESQANRFASAFLLPRAQFSLECTTAVRGSRLSWGRLADLKRRWGVSKAALLYRGRQLGIFTETQYVSGVVHLKRHGEAIREAEDDSIEPESPEVLAEGLTVLQSHFGISLTRLAEELKISTGLLNSLIGTASQLGNAQVIPLFPARAS